MTAGSYNFTIEQGTKFSTVLTWKSGGALVDLTGWTAELEAKSDAPERPVVLSLSTTVDENGNGIILGGEDGTITLLAKSALTLPMDFSNADFQLNLIDPSGEPKALIKGALSLEPKV